MIMHDGEGTGETGEGIFRDFIWTTETQQKLNRNSIPKYIFELRVDTGDLPACLVNFPRICQIIILMNYKAVIGTKAASTEWFPTLSKWSLWRGAERRY